MFTVYSATKETQKLNSQALSVKMDANEKTNRCHNFSFVNDMTKEFYSPNFPNNYPNNSDCERVIKGKQY